MPELLNNAQTSNGYTAALTLGPGSDVTLLTFDVLREPAYVQFWVPASGFVPGSKWVLEGVERLFVANSYGCSASGVLGCRFRSAIPGKPATIRATLSYKRDPTVVMGTISSVATSSSGEVSPL